MLAVLGGLGAALAWATGTLAAARASRLVGPRLVLAWVMLVGLVVVAPFTAVAGVPRGVGVGEAAWLVVSGLANIVGLLLVYRAMRIGKVSIVSPITSTEGAIAALLAVLQGERLGAASAVLLGVIVLGVVLASRGEDPEAEGAHPLRASLYAGCAALSFGVGLFSTGHVSASLPLAWAVLPPRLIGVVAVTLPLLARGRLRIEGPAMPYVLLSGLCEVAGFTSYAVGSRHGIAIAAVLASQFAAFVAVGSFVLLHERLRPSQIAGIATIVVAVATLTALRA